MEQNTFLIGELMETELDPVEFYVDGLLPQGLVVLASPPKFGKSWFVLELCLSVASGYNFLNRLTKMCHTLYLALEDSLSRLKSRITTIWQGKEIPYGLFMRLHAAPLGGGLIQELEEHIAQDPSTRLIVIDTLQKVRSSMASETSYGYDYRELGTLKAFADKHKLCLVLVHHLRKMRDDDVFAMISGTNGLTGCADTMIVLSKSKRTDAETIMSITGRDVSSEELVLTRNPKTQSWIMKNEEPIKDEMAELDRYLANPLVEVIVDALKECGRWTGTMTEFCRRCSSYPYHPLLANKPNKMSLLLKELSPELLKYNQIVYVPPTQSTRSHSFYNNDNNDKNDKTMGIQGDDSKVLEPYPRKSGLFACVRIDS